MEPILLKTYSGEEREELCLQPTCEETITELVSQLSRPSM